MTGLVRQCYVGINKEKTLVMVKRCLPLLATLVLLSGHASAQSVSASYEGGLVSISCSNAPLASVFEKLEEVAGLELILEDAVKNKRLTANLENVPLAMAIQRLLEGNGVNYAVMMDPRDWGRVDKIFVGAGGGGPARAAPPPRRPLVHPADPVDDGYDDFDDMDDDMMDEDDDLDDMNDGSIDEMGRLTSHRREARRFRATCRRPRRTRAADSPPVCRGRSRRVQTRSNRTRPRRRRP